MVLMKATGQPVLQLVGALEVAAYLHDSPNQLSKDHSLLIPSCQFKTRDYVIIVSDGLKVYEKEQVRT